MSKPATNPTTYANESGTQSAGQLDTSFGNAYAAINDLNTYTNGYDDSGAANAYVVAGPPAGITFSLVKYLRVSVLIANANNAASTLNFFGSGVKSIVTQTGAALSGGELVGGQITEFMYTGTAWQILSTSPSAPTTIPVVQAQLQLVSATQIKVVPSNGNRIMINGTLFIIPSAGFTANNTSVFVDGTGGQNLASSTLYYVYVFSNSGTLTVDYSTTAYTIDTTTGLAIKGGPVATRTLVGHVFTNGSAQFVNGSVRSWLNDPGVVLSNSGGGSNGTSTPAQIVSISFSGWAGEVMAVDAYGTYQLASNGSAVSYLAFDTVSLGTPGGINTQTNSTVPWGQSTGATIPSDGQHSVQVYGLNANNNGAISFGVTRFTVTMGR